MGCPSGCWSSVLQVHHASTLSSCKRWYWWFATAESRRNFSGRHIAVLLAYVHSTTRLLDYIFIFNVLCCQEFQGCVFNLGISRTFNASSLAQPEPVCIINCPSCHPLLSFSLLTSIAQLQIWSSYAIDRRIAHERDANMSLRSAPYDCSP
jgi:hypothetical protein